MNRTAKGSALVQARWLRGFGLGLRELVDAMPVVIFARAVLEVYRPAATRPAARPTVALQ